MGLEKRKRCPELELELYRPKWIESAYTLYCRGRSSRFFHVTEYKLGHTLRTTAPEKLLCMFTRRHEREHLSRIVPVSTVGETTLTVINREWINNCGLFMQWVITQRWKRENCRYRREPERILGNTVNLHLTLSIGSATWSKMTLKKKKTQQFYHRLIYTNQS